MDLFLVWIVDLFLAVVLVVAVATVILFVFLSFLLKDLTIVGVVDKIVTMQETAEFLFLVVLVAVIATAFLIPTGFVFVDDPLLVCLLDGKSLSADSSLSHISVNSLIAP